MNKKIKNIIFFGGAIGISVFFFIFIVTSVWIRYEVQQDCRRAQEKYEGECVEAVSALLDDESNTFRERNSAIWTLGQLGDERALPVLEKYYTGNIPDREPLEEVISQYELKKAIDLASGGFNLTKVVWPSNF